MSIILHLCPCLNKANVGSNQMLTFQGRYFNPPLPHFFTRLGCSVPVHLPGVLLRVDGHSSNPHFGAGSEHADGDLTWGGNVCLSRARHGVIYKSQFWGEKDKSGRTRFWDVGVEFDKQTNDLDGVSES